MLSLMEKKIIVTLRGGLGNQMFQCAFAYAASKKQNINFCLDIGYLKDRSLTLTTYREYELDVFRSKLHVIDLSSRFEKFVYKKIKRFDDKQESSLCFNSSYLLWNSSVVSGYFQSEKYFSEIRPDILSLFKFDETRINQATKELSLAIKRVTSVSLHIRRGDYISDDKTNRFHGVCSLSYYLESIETICKATESPVFFIFSDDIQWVKDNLKTDKHLVFVDHNKAKDSYQDMFLMSCCEHNIIANSSFSWWGAWLNPSINKIVIAPKQWVVSGEVDTRDIVPEKWLRI